MDTTSRPSYYEKNTHLTSTIKNENSSSISSDSDKTHNKPPQKNRKGKKMFKKSCTPDYFPIYTPPWATMNYIYLDLLRQLSLESEIRSSLSQMDNQFDYNYLKGVQATNKFEEEQYCERRKLKQKKKCYEDFQMSCSQLCLSCLKKAKCSSCGQTIIQNREPETASKEFKPLRHCKCLYDSFPKLHDLQHIPFSQCCACHCQKPCHPCHSLNHKVCDSLNHVSVDPPVRERPETYENTKRAHNSLVSEACNESDPNLNKLLIENCFSADNNCHAKNVNTKNQPDLQIASKDVKNHDFENDYGIVPSFLGGTGDEGSKLQVKRSRKSRLPKSTAYFLPISSLTTNKQNMNFPRFNS